MINEKRHLISSFTHGFVKISQGGVYGIHKEILNTIEEWLNNFIYSSAGEKSASLSANLSFIIRKYIRIT